VTTRTTVGFGIIGGGMIAEYHRKAIMASADLGARLVAVGDNDPSRFESISARLCAPCMSVDQVLAHPDVDAVCICTPSGFHAAQTIAAACAGKHVLVEKPMALTVADADAAIAACRSAGVLLGVVLQRRANTLCRTVHDAIAAGKLGDLTMGIVTTPYFRSPAYYAQAAWRGTWELDGGGVLMNQGIHQIDLLLWFMGDPVDIQARAATLHHAIEVEDTLAATLRFANGALATVTASTAAAPGYPHRIEVYGAGGGVQIEGETLIRWDMAGGSEPPLRPLGQLLNTPAGAGGDPRGIFADGHTAVLRDFVQALRGGGRPMADGAEGRRSVAAILGIYQAAGIR